MADTALSVLTLWRLVEDSPERAVFQGEHAFWRWPPDALWPLARPYLGLGVGVAILVALLVYTARVSYTELDGTLQHGWRTGQLGAALVLGVIYLAVPLGLGMRAPVRLEARPGQLLLDGRPLAAAAGQEIQLLAYSASSRHGQGAQRETISSSLLNLEVGARGGSGESIATFSADDAAVVREAARALSRVSGLALVERPRD